LEQKHAQINGALAAPLARELGFDYVASWDDMDVGEENLYDCTHSTVSPNNFKAAIKSIAKVLAR